MRIFWVAMALGTLAVAANAAHGGLWPFAPNGSLLVRDFATIWAAAVRTIAGDAALVYDHGAHDLFYASLLGQPPKDTLAFGYPPSALVIFWPLGLMPYGTSMLVYILIGFVAWVCVLQQIVRDWPTSLAMALACGGATQTIMLGQSGYAEAALLAGGLLTIPRKPVLAGFLFGLLALKPHLVLALGAYLLFTRQWAVILTACATSIGLAVVAAVAFGWEIWPIYANASAELTASIAARSETVVERMMQSPFALASLWTSPGTALALHSCIALAAIAMLIAVLIRTKDHFVRSAAVIAATLVVTPYSFLYDATVLVAAVAFLMSVTRRPDEIAIALVAIALPTLWYATLAPFSPAGAVMLLGLCLVIALRERRETPPSGAPARR